jgi:mannosyltransferase
MISSDSRWLNDQPTWLWLLLIMGLAAGLRLVSLGRDSLWFDEAISHLASELPLARILDNTVQSSHPPLYYLMLHYWRQIVPETDAAMRLLSLVWNLLLIPIVYVLTRSLSGHPRLAIMAAALVAISPFHVLYSHELRMYTQLMCLVTAGTWAYWKARKAHGWRYWFLLGILFLAAVYTHLFALLAMAAIGLHAMIYRLNRRAFYRTCLVLFIVGLLLFPWAATLIGESNKGLGSMRPLVQDNISNPIKPLTSLVFLLFGMSDSYAYSAIVLFTTLAIVVVMLIEGRKVKRENVPPGLVLLVLMLACVLGIPVLVFLIHPFFLPERTMAAASPFLIILLAWGSARRRSPLPYLVITASVIMFSGTILYLAGEPIKPPYREVINFVAQNRAEGDAVLHTSDGSYLPALRYAELPRHAVLAGDPDPRKPIAVYQALGGSVWTLPQATAAAERLWLIVALEHSIEWQQEQVAYFAEHYVELESYDFSGVVVKLYQLN